MNVFIAVLPSVEMNTSWHYLTCVTGVISVSNNVRKYICINYEVQLALWMSHTLFHHIQLAHWSQNAWKKIATVI